MIKRITILITLCIITSNCNSTKKTKKVVFSDLSYMENWEYFSFQDTLNVEVIEHSKSMAHCGTIAFASVTIAKSNNDTIRIINLCNLENYKNGALVKFISAKKPSFVFQLPTSQNYNSDASEFKASYFDIKVKKTTYGSAIR